MKRLIPYWLIRHTQAFTYKFGTAINWSALSNIGNSKVARLTILMPVVGYLIIFNSAFIGFLATSLPTGAEVNSDDLWAYLYSKNMIFLYFGLLIFGLGVSLYNITVPMQIKKYPSVEDYISTMEQIGTKHLVTGSFSNLIKMFSKNLSEEEKSSMFSNQNIGFPHHVSDDLHRLIEEVFAAIDDGSWDEQSDKGRMRFRTGSGYLETGEIIEVMYSGRRFDWHFINAMKAEVAARSKDVFYIEHKALELNARKIRFLTFMFYGTGLILTAFPTVLTSIMILKHWS